MKRIKELNVNEEHRRKKAKKETYEVIILTTKKTRCKNEYIIFTRLSIFIIKPTRCTNFSNLFSE